MNGRKPTGKYSIRPIDNIQAYRRELYQKTLKYKAYNYQAHVCEVCNYTTKRRSDLERHNISKRHQRNAMQIYFFKTNKKTRLS